MERLWPRKGACTALMWVCRIVTSSGGDLRSRCPLHRLLPSLHLRFWRSPRLSLGFAMGRSYLRSRPLRDERGPRVLPKVFHWDGESVLPRHCGLYLASRNSTGRRTRHTACPRCPAPLGSRPEIVSGTHPESCRRDKRKQNLK